MGSFTRPIEWLHELAERPDGYRRLFDDAGGLPAAAWRLARARCQVRRVSTHVPSRVEVRAAAQELAERLGLARVPTSATLQDDCESLGLLVL